MSGTEKSSLDDTQSEPSTAPASTQGSQEAWKVTVPLDQLYLDPNNFRLIHEEKQVHVNDELITDSNVCRRTAHLVRGERNQNVQDLIKSFLSNGFLPVDQIQVRQLAEKVYLVVEGNRRVATLKYLKQEFEKSGMDLGRLNSGVFYAVPVVYYSEAGSLHHLTLAALKHISGNRKWGEWNQAKLIEKLYREHDLGEGEICDRIGISKTEFRRSLRALSLLDQYIASDYGDQFGRHMFPIFREAARNAAMKDWMGWNDESFKADHVIHRELFFSLISQEPVEDEGEDAGFGDEYQPPAIVKRDQVRQLSIMLHDEKAMAELKQTRDLAEAYRASDLVFQERIDMAVKTLGKDIDTLDQLNIQGKYQQELETSFNRLRNILARTKTPELVGVEQKTPYHDRIDGHLSAIHVHVFKKLYDLRVDVLSQINVFAGENNSGKTTLLEAILLLVRQSDPDGLLEVIRRRGKVAEEHLDVQWLVNQIPSEMKVSGVFDGQDAKVTLNALKEEDVTLDHAHYMTSLEIDACYAEHRQSSRTRLSAGRDRETFTRGIKILCPIIYSSPFFLNEPHRYAVYYDKSFQSKALPKIWKFLKSSLIPSLNDIRITKDLRHFKVDDKDFEEVVDLSSYGEGVQRVFFLGLLFASAADGILLIDEFENAIHAYLMEQLAPFIHGLAKLYNVQVFLTSHSKECIDAFVKNIPEVNDFSYHALVTTDEGIQVRQYTGKKWARLLNAGDLDLRRLK